MARAQRARSSETARTAQARKAEVAETAHGQIVQLPGVSAEFHRPNLPSREEISRTVQRYMPPPAHLAFYAGLAVVATLGVIDWPIAAAIGVGTAVVGASR